MNIFLSTPISLYRTENELHVYKKTIEQLIFSLRKKYNVLSEIENIDKVEDYDSSEQSFLKDFTSIQKSKELIHL